MNNPVFYAEPIIQKRIHDEAMNKFKLMIQLIKNIKKGLYQNKNDVDKWLVDHSFTEDERIRLKWVEYTI